MSIAQDNVARALEWINQRYPEHQREKVRGYLMAELGKIRLESISEFLPVVSSEERRGAISLIAHHWATTDSTALAAFAQQHNNPTIKNEIYGHLVSALANQQRFEQAKELVKTMPFSEIRVSTITTLGHELAKRDPVAAMQWAVSLPKGPEIQAACRAILSSLPQSGNLASMNQLVDQAPAGMQAEFRHQFGRMLGSLDAANLLASIQEDESGAVLNGAIETVSAAQLPELAERMDRIRDPQIRINAISSYVNRLFEQNAERAASWVLQRPPTDREWALASLINNWYRADSAGLSEWASRLPAGTDQNRVLRGLALQLRTSDLRAARDVAARIQDPTLRSEVLKTLGND